MHDDDAPLLIVGLGNPGSQYTLTRHNIGFLCVDAMEKTYRMPSGASWDSDKKFKGDVVKIKVGGKTVYLLKPSTYMNLSGEAMQAVMHYYKIPLNNVLIVYDDTALAFGRVRFRSKGSAGSHNGMKSILQHAGGSNAVARFRIGIDESPGIVPMKNYVLTPFSNDEQGYLQELLENCNRALALWIKEDTAAAANDFNGQWMVAALEPPPPPEPEPATLQNASPTSDTESVSE
jgi:PTH1 family peptidyl-tRNA hydrolase